MPQSQRADQFIVLADFSPGIHDDWMHGAAPSTDGTAQLSGTYGCVASTGGGLMPAPRKVQTLRQGLITAPGTYLEDDARMHVLAFRNMSPIFGEIDGVEALPAYPDQPWITYSWFFAPDDVNFQENGRIRTYFCYSTDGVTSAPTYPFSNPAPASPFIYDAVSSTSGNIATYTDPSHYAHGRSAIDNNRANNASPNTAGTVQTVMSYSHGSIGPFSIFPTVFPSNAAPATNSTQTIPMTADAIGYVMCHQGRIIGFRSEFAQGYGATGFSAGSEIMDFTAPNNNTSVTTSGLLFVEEHPTGYDSWVSMNASQLFLLKRRGGAVVISGDINNPSVQYMAGVVSTHGSPNLGALTPTGYVYGTTRGVWLWTGGSNSTVLSPQIDGYFWRPPGVATTTTPVENRLGLVGSFTYMYPFVFAPNNFLYDTRYNSWWRYDNPDTAPPRAFHDTSANGLVLACSAIVSNTQTEAISWWDVTQGQSSFQWVSQPLQKSQGRVLNYRELDITVQGLGTVTITLNGLDGASQAEVFAIDSTERPVTINRPTEMRSHDVTVTIQSAATNASDAAPRIYRVVLGYYEEQTARPVQ